VARLRATLDHLDGRPSWRQVETLVRDAWAHVAPPKIYKAFGTKGR